MNRNHSIFEISFYFSDFVKKAMKQNKFEGRYAEKNS